MTPDLALSLARDAYSASTSYFDASIRKEVEGDLRRFQGQHPTGSKYLSEAYRAKSRLFRPKTRGMIRKHEAAAAEAFFATRDVVNIEPQDDNNAIQKGSASLHKELLQYRLTRTIPWFLLCVGAYQDAMNVGFVCSYQHWVFDKKKGKDQPNVRLVPIENVRFDPGASWIDPVNTSPYFIELIPMYVKDVKSRMQQPDPKTREPKWKPLDDAAILAAVKGYSDSIRLTREQGRQDPKENTTAINNYTVVWVHKNIVEHEGDDYCYYTLGDQQLLSDPVPLGESYHHGKRPYVIGYSALETHKNYPAGPNRMAKDLQAEANEIANSRIENVKLVMNKRYLVGRNRQVDIRSLTRNVAGSATLVNDTEKDVRELEFNDVTASAYKEQEVLNLDFDEITGNFSSGSVQSNRRMNETLGGMEIVEDDANKVGGYQLRTFVETWVEPVLRQIILLEQAYETDEVILALVGQKARLDELGFDVITDDLIEQELILSVSVGMGPTSPEKKINRFLTAMRSLKELLVDGVLVTYGLKFDEVCKEVFGNLGYKDGSRFFDLDSQDPRVAQLVAEMQKLQQQLDSKFPPELIDAQVRHIDAQIAALEPKNKLAEAQAVKTGVEASFSAMQGAEVIAAVPQVAPIADVIMQGAGYQLPNPPGVDPNFPQPAGTPNSVAAAVAPPGGVGTITQGEVSGGAPGDTSPNTPDKKTPGMGVKDGIETQESDSAGPGFADGGYVSVLERGDMASPAYRAHLEQRQALQTTLPEAMVPLGAIANVARMAITRGPAGGAGYAGRLPEGFVGSRPGYGMPSRQPMPAERRRMALEEMDEALGVAGKGMVRNQVQDYGNAASSINSMFPQDKKPFPGYADGGYIDPYAVDASRYAGHSGPFDASAVEEERKRLELENMRRYPEAYGARASTGLTITGLTDETSMGLGINPLTGQPFKRQRDERRGSVIDAVARMSYGYANGGQVKGYGEGGMIAGPGTGTSDSIPAMTETGAPLRVSNGEYKIPPQVVAALGKDFFDELIAQYHTPVQGQAPIYQADAPMDTPLGMETGTIIIPADVVAALGEDFFDQLLAQFGGMQ